jgi:hypothetical protein
MALALLLTASPGRADDAASPLAIKLHESSVFVLSRPDGPELLAHRVQRVTRALAQAAQAGETAVTVVVEGPKAVVVAGEMRIVELTGDDAEAAGASSTAALAEDVAERVRRALVRERRRVALSNAVFSASLIVSLALLGLLATRKLRELLARAGAYISMHPERVPALRLRALEVVGQSTVRNVLLVALPFARWLVAAGVGYAWLLMSLSLFEGTRPWAEALTGALLAPVTSLVSRVALSLPLALLVLFALSLLAFLVRLIELWFDGLARGESESGPTLPREGARFTSGALRGGLIIAFLLLAAPVITGDAEGVLARVGWVFVWVLSAASVPLLANALVGWAFASTHVLTTGRKVEYGGASGRVRRVGWLFAELEADDGSLQLVPHLGSLVRVTRSHERGVP